MNEILRHGKNDTSVRKPELLAPAANYEGFLACVNAGCDAVYLGGRMFGARAFADNFSDEEIVRAIRYAHVFGVKVYLTINTLIKEREFEKCLSFVKPFADAGLDAFIVQDLGLMSELKKRYPDVSLHISTQAFSTGIFSFNYYKELGASRVVTARELTLEELKKIRENTDLEIEAFVHGAMCYCYSGQCLFSSTLGGRSGNRGRCAGPCRQPYAPFLNGRKFPPEYVLSMKDQCALPILDKLVDAGIDSFKIEGRMKKSEYAAFVTAMYRKYIDRYCDDPGNYRVDGDDLEKLMKVYLRSETSTGYYETGAVGDMISLDSPSYSGSDEELLAKIREKYIENSVKCGVSGYFYARAGEEIKFTLSTDERSVCVTGAVAEAARSTATTPSQIEKQLRRINDTPFEYNELQIDAGEDVFIPVSVLNAIRRDAVEKLIDEFTAGEI